VGRTSRALRSPTVIIAFLGSAGITGGVDYFGGWAVAVRGLPSETAQPIAGSPVRRTGRQSFKKRIASAGRKKSLPCGSPVRDRAHAWAT
jgi:hypothetical protein